MTVEHSRRNSFEAVCEIASQENWCWNLDCTTCGHMHFNYAFLEIINGKHPDDKEWVTHSSRHHALTRLLGPMPRPFQLSEGQQRALIGIAVDASLQKIASLAKFPDWLGYLGLVLFYTERTEDSERRLTKAWVPQLQEFCASDTGTVWRLQSILDDESRILGIRELEEVERAVNYRRHSPLASDFRRGVGWNT